MTAYEQIWPVAEDHYGIITSAEAKEMGVSKQRMVAMEKSGRLERIGRGVYQVKHHVPGTNDVYAAAVAIAGEGAYLRSASVLYMLGLTPANPSVVYVGTPKRIRRRLPRGFRLKRTAPCGAVEYDGFEGIRCQGLVDALKTARDEGAVEADRIAAAAAKAKEKGLLSDEECAQFQEEVLEYQIAQKLHGASAPGSKRAHDLVDLQLIAANADLDLRRVRDVCVRLFKYRKRQAWPPTIAVGTDWESLYAEQSANVPVLPTVEEAVAWTQRLIDRIDAAR